MIVNGNEYTIPNIDYNAICDLDSYGVNLLSAESPSPMILIRGFLALCLGSTTKAGREIEKHISDNGIEDMKAWSEEIENAIEDGGFFAAMRKAADAQKKKSAAKKKVQKTPEAEEAFGMTHQE